MGPASQAMDQSIKFSNMTTGKLPLRGLRVVSLALNLPGPAALWRLRQAGASCLKLEPPSGDPMGHYQAQAYAEMHAGIRCRTLDLKEDKGRAALHKELARSDVLLTSFRPSALQRLGIGHDLTYMAEQDLVQGTALPPTLYADMCGALLASEAVCQALLLRGRTGRGTHREVALTDAAAWLAHPRRWGLTQPGGTVGGAHAGYQVYACKDGRVAMAALEPHFALALATVAGLPDANLLRPSAREQLAAWCALQTRRQLERLARQHDLPLHTMPRGTGRGSKLGSD